MAEVTTATYRVEFSGRASGALGVFEPYTITFSLVGTPNQHPKNDRALTDLAIMTAISQGLEVHHVTDIVLIN